MIIQVHYTRITQSLVHWIILVQRFKVIWHRRLVLFNLFSYLGLILAFFFFRNYMSKIARFWMASIKLRLAVWLCRQIFFFFFFLNSMQQSMFSFCRSISYEMPENNAVSYWFPIGLYPNTWIHPLIFFYLVLNTLEVTRWVAMLKERAALRYW